jgi:hypothetical protein
MEEATKHDKSMILGRDQKRDCQNFSRIMSELPVCGLDWMKSMTIINAPPFSELKLKGFTSAFFHSKPPHATKGENTRKHGTSLKGGGLQCQQTSPPSARPHPSSSPVLQAWRCMSVIPTHQSECGMQNDLLEAVGCLPSPHGRNRTVGSAVCHLPHREVGDRAPQASAPHAALVYESRFVL